MILDFLRLFRKFVIENSSWNSNSPNAPKTPHKCPSRSRSCLIFLFQPCLTSRKEGIKDET
jgi:hypothetical protein